MRITFRSKSYSDTEVLQILKSSDEKSQNKVIQYLYNNNWKSIRSYIGKNSGTEEEAADIFQEVLIVFYDKIQQDKFNGDSSVSTYIFSIAKNLWMNSLRRKNREMLQMEVVKRDMDSDPAEAEISNMKLFYSLFEKLSQECQKILKYAYYESLSMKEIQMRFEGLKNEQSAKTKKYRCMKNLVTIFEQNRVTQESFYA